MLTDGKQSASETLDDVMSERVEHRQGEDCEFLFIGANQDATVTVNGIGIDRDNALNIKHSGEGARQAHQSGSGSIGQAGKERNTGGYAEEDVDRSRRTRDERDGLSCSAEHRRLWYLIR